MGALSRKQARGFKRAVALGLGSQIDFTSADRYAESRNRQRKLNNLWARAARNVVYNAQFDDRLPLRYRWVWIHGRGRRG